MSVDKVYEIELMYLSQQLSKRSGAFGNGVFCFCSPRLHPSTACLSFKQAGDSMTKPLTLMHTEELTDSLLMVDFMQDLHMLIAGWFRAV